MMMEIYMNQRKTRKVTTNFKTTKQNVTIDVRKYVWYTFILLHQQIYDIWIVR